MYLAGPRYQVGREVDHRVEAAERAYALSDLERERTAAAFENRQFAAPDRIPDDGLNHHDPADAFCLSFASPSIGERDPNEVFHDRYRGTVYER